MAENGTSGRVQIAIAIIGVLGSLGVAYLTTGVKFKSDVDDASLKIASLSKEVQESKGLAQELQTALTSQRGDLDKRIAGLQQQLSDAESKNADFQAKLDSLRNDIDSSKQKVAEVNTAADNAVKRIDAARLRSLTVRPEPTP